MGKKSIKANICPKCGKRLRNSGKVWVCICGYSRMDEDTVKQKQFERYAISYFGH